jgi:NAD-dependent DNA ligase
VTREPRWAMAHRGTGAGTAHTTVVAIDDAGQPWQTLTPNNQTSTPVFVGGVTVIMPLLAG